MLTQLLNIAYASEWIAYYQYWLGAKLISGPMKDVITSEFNTHAIEELSHATLLADRIIQLGGIPVLLPKDWDKLSSCKYAAPDNPESAVLLNQNIKSEQCAILAYKDLMRVAQDKNDIITYTLAVDILKKEIEHEEDLEFYKVFLKSLLK